MRKYTPKEVGNLLDSTPRRSDWVENEAAQMLHDYDDLLHAILHNEPVRSLYERARRATEGSDVRGRARYDLDAVGDCPRFGLPVEHGGDFAVAFNEMAGRFGWVAGFPAQPVGRHEAVLLRASRDRFVFDESGVDEFKCSRSAAGVDGGGSVFEDVSADALSGVAEVQWVAILRHVHYHTLHDPWNKTTVYEAPTTDDAAIVFDDTGAMYEAVGITQNDATGEIVVMGRPIMDGRPTGQPIRVDLTHPDTFDLLSRAQGNPRDRRFETPEGTAQ